MRQLARERTDSLTQQQKESQSQSICHHLSESIRKLSLPDGAIIASYAGLSFEPDLLELHSRHPTLLFAYPLCEREGLMHFHLVNDPKELISGMLGIREPDPTAHLKISPDDLALVLCPASAYTPTGERLGKGGAYYDRYLQKLPDTPKIGIIFSQLLFDVLPTEQHDIIIPCVVTDQFVTPAQ